MGSPAWCLVVIIVIVITLISILIIIFLNLKEINLSFQFIILFIYHLHQHDEPDEYNEYFETWEAGSWLDGDPPVFQVPVITFMGVGGVKYGGKDFYLWLLKEQVRKKYLHLIRRRSGGYRK